MAKRQKPRMGRPPRGEYPEKTQVANFRIRPDTKRLLIEAAERSKRSLSQEIEHQLRRSLADMGTGPTFAIMRVIGKAVDSLVNFKAPGAHWADDPYLFAEAAKVMNVMLQMLRPTGEPPEKTMGYGPPRQGEFAVTETLRALQVVDTSVPFKKQTARQRELTMLRGDLGDLADRPRPRGYSAEENRQMRRLIEQLAPLRRKDESTLTAKERERMNALWAQLEAIKPGEKK